MASQSGDSLPDEIPLSDAESELPDRVPLSPDGDPDLGGGMAVVPAPPTPVAGLDGYPLRAEASPGTSRSPPRLARLMEAAPARSGRGRGAGRKRQVEVRQAAVRLVRVSPELSSDAQATNASHAAAGPSASANVVAKWPSFLGVTERSAYDLCVLGHDAGSVVVPRPARGFAGHKTGDRSLAPWLRPSKNRRGIGRTWRR